MGRVASRLEELGLTLPAPPTEQTGAGRMAWVNIRGERVFVSGHGAGEPGPPHAPFGRVGAEVPVAEATRLAREAGLSVIGSLAAALGDLDRVTGWCRVFGMVRAAPGFDRPHEVLDGFSALVLDVFGPGVGRHARSAVGVAELPFGMAVEVEAEVLVRV